MPEWLKSILAAFGGGTVVLVGMMTIFKGLFIKFFESSIESSFEKSIEKFKNKLERSTRAYEILLDREMRFYDHIDPIIAQLILVMRDLEDSLRYDPTSNREEQYNAFRKYFLQYCELLKQLKNEALLHQAYLSTDIFTAVTNVVKLMQDGLLYWRDIAIALSNGEYDKIDSEKNEHLGDELRAQISCVELLIQKRLRQLSGEE